MKSLIGFIPQQSTPQHERVKNLTGNILELNKETTTVAFDIKDSTEPSIVTYPTIECKPYFVSEAPKKIKGLSFFEFSDQLGDFKVFNKQGTQLFKWELFWSGYSLAEIRRNFTLASLLLFFASCTPEQACDDCDRVTDVKRFELASGLITYELTMYNECEDKVKTFSYNTFSQNNNPKVGDCRK